MHAGSEVISGIAKLPEGLVIILDIDKLLVSEEHSAILETAKAA
jgi:chemotaxis signal transduction protein